MRVALVGNTARNQKDRLERLLTTPWEIDAPADDAAALRGALARADACVGATFAPPAGAPLPRLKLVQSIGAGVDAFNLDALPPDCTLCNVYEHEIAIAEYVLGAILHWTLRFDRFDGLMRQGRWDGSGRCDGETHGELHGRSLGLIGFGRIGRAVAQRALAFGLKVRAVRRNGRPDADLPVEWVGGAERLSELLAASSIVVIACPLTPETRGLIGAEQLAAMRPGSLLVNVARAEIVDETALYEALRRRRLGGAVLDVWYRYPHSTAEVLHPSHQPFWTLDNVVMTPHLSAWTEAMIARRWGFVAANLDRLARGEALQNVVAGAAQGRSA